MFVGITNTPREYAWGSFNLIADLLGREPSGRPEAELWLGAHPLAPSRILAPSSVGGHPTLDAWIAADPETTLGPDRSSDTLPFLLKLLAAEEPLSIQAHPSIEQAAAGYADEKASGIPIGAAHRTYKDKLHKPELTFALSDTFEVLAGFRSVSETRLLVSELTAGAASESDAGALNELGALLAGDDPLRNTMEWAFGGSEGAIAAIDAVVRASERAATTSSFSREYATIVEIAERHPADPGILVALLLNRLSVAQGQAVYLPTGNVHAYLKGLAVEIMAASDNVVRGGLTSKHVDAAELAKVVRWEVLPAPLWRAEDGGPGVEVFRPDVPDFALARVAVGTAGYDHGYQNSGPEFTSFAPSGPAIALVVAGEVKLSGALSTSTLLRGESSFVTPDEGVLEIAGDGIVFIATTNR